jgi:predicted MFS family arabinose efflux permease
MEKNLRRAWTVVALLWVVALLNYVDRQVIFSLFPPLKTELHLSDVELGLISTVFLWVYGLVSPFAGYLSDRYSRQRIVIVSLLIWSAVTWLTSRATDFSTLITARGLMGISEACYLPAGLALITDYHGAATRSRAVGLHQTGWYVGIAFGGLFGGWIGEHYGWRFAFILLGVAGIAYSLFLYFTLARGAEARPAESRPQFLSSLRELVTTKYFVIMCMLNAVQSIGWWVVYTWLPLFLYEQFHMSLTEAGGTATFYLQSASFAGILAGGWLADRWSHSSDRGRALTQGIGLILAGPCLAVVGGTTSTMILIAALVIAGIGRGAYDCNTMPVMCQFTRPETCATGYGVYNFASCAVSGSMMAVAGAVKSSVGLGMALEGAGALMLLCGLYLLSARFSSQPSVAVAAVPQHP